MARRTDNFRLEGVCRGEGYGYALVRTAESLPRIVGVARTPEGVEVPVKTMPQSCPPSLSQGSLKAWVLAFPLLAVDLRVEVRLGSLEGAPLASFVFSRVTSKFQSRFLSTCTPERTRLMRGSEERCSSTPSPITILGAWPLPDGSVAWRTSVTFAFPCEGEQPELRVFDSSMRPVDFRLCLLEDQVVPSGVDDGSRRIVTFSAVLPKGLDTFVMATSLGEFGENRDFASICPARIGRHLRTFGQAPVGAANADEWERWLVRERKANLSCQPRPKHPDDPSFALVVSYARGEEHELYETLDSILRQTHQGWQAVLVGPVAPEPEVAARVEEDGRIRSLVVADAPRGELEVAALEQVDADYVGFVRSGDLLEADALECFDQGIRRHRQAEFLYCDEDRLSGGRLFSPRLKTCPNLEKLRSHNYIGSLQMVSGKLLRRMGPVPGECAGASGYWRALRAFELEAAVVQVPRVLYHAREDRSLDDMVAARVALEGHLGRCGVSATVQDGPVPQSLRVRYELPSPLPKVSVVIPSKDHVDLLRPCLESILKKSSYPDFEVVVVENNSTSRATFDYYDEVCAADSRVRVVTWRPEVAGTFNYSAIVNEGARSATGDLLLFLNNDTQVIADDWIEELVAALAQRPEVAVVGAKLVFPDGLIQHAGMAYNPNGMFMHLGETTPANLVDHDRNVCLPHDSTMVTGACQLVRRSVFDELGGYDEALAVAFNDGDFCLRARDAGYAVTYTPYAVLYHKEFSSRGRESTDTRQQARFLKEYAILAARHAERFVAGDPSINPNFNQWEAQFHLR